MNIRTLIVIAAGLTQEILAQECSVVLDGTTHELTQIHVYQTPNDFGDHMDVRIICTLNPVDPGRDNADDIVWELMEDEQRSVEVVISSRHQHVTLARLRWGAHQTMVSGVLGNLEFDGKQTPQHVSGSLITTEPFVLSQTGLQWQVNLTIDQPINPSESAQ